MECNEFVRTSATLVMRPLITPSAEYAQVPVDRFFAYWLTSAWSRYLAWRLRGQTRRTLRSLDDRILADIGLKRSEIDAVFCDLEQPKLHCRSE
jgi:uncharacterized protein YjiS (DUF1127 family)